MASLNKVMLIGNLGRDPEVRTMQNGSKVANLNLACSESWKDKATGERKERTEWVRIVIFGALADIVEQYASKGSKLYVCGSMQTRKWSDKDGVEKYTTEVVLQPFRGELVLLDSKTAGDDDADDTNQDRGWAAEAAAPAKPAARYGSQRQAPRDDDDEIPF